MEVQVESLEKKLAEQQEKLQKRREREAAESGGRAPADLLAEARRKRDTARRDLLKAQTRLSSLVAERRDAHRRLEKLAKQKAATASTAEMVLPSVALRGGGDETAVEEIRTLMRENEELEAAVAQHQATKLQLEKLQNEKRDTLRRIKELRQEDKMVQDQLEMKRAELDELQSLVKPSSARQKHDAEVDRLRKEINTHSAARTHAEREGAALAKRLLRVRTVLAGWLKTEGVHKPQQPLPAADDALAGRLAQYVTALAAKVRRLESTVSEREERAAALEESSESAAAELRRLVARRSTATRKAGATGVLTDGAAAADPATGAEEDSGALKPSVTRAALRGAPKRRDKGQSHPETRRTTAQAGEQTKGASEAADAAAGGSAAADARGRNGDDG